MDMSMCVRVHGHMRIQYVRVRMYNLYFDFLTMTEQRVNRTRALSSRRVFPGTTATARVYYDDMVHASSHASRANTRTHARSHTLHDVVGTLWYVRAYQRVPVRFVRFFLGIQVDVRRRPRRRNRPKGATPPRRWRGGSGVLTCGSDGSACKRASVSRELVFRCGWVFWGR